MKPLLFNEERHEPLLKASWCEDKAYEAVNSIFHKTVESFDPSTLWPTSSNEDAVIESNKSLYYGSSGTLWGLNEISKNIKIDLPWNLADLIEDFYSKYLESPDTKDLVPSYYLGESGILLFHYKLTKNPLIADRLFEVVKSNTKNPVNEALWGCPGTMLAALFMYRWTKNQKWKKLFESSADYLFQEMHQSENGIWIWTQDLYGKRYKYLGAGHGFFGNVYPLLQGLDLLSEERKDLLLKRIKETTLKSSIESEGLVNWPCILDDLEYLVRVQWCHGSPGVITAMESFPLNYSNEVEELLLKGGELIWEAGPLSKGIGICHGTDGNGFAFLKLYKRTRDRKWLDRARSFAMHSLERRNGRFTLWTGEIGLALYLLACIGENSSWPLLDYV